MIFTSVDFPEPFLPAISSVSPSLTRAEISWKMIRRLKVFLRPRASSWMDIGYSRITGILPVMR